MVCFFFDHKTPTVTMVLFKLEVEEMKRYTRKRLVRLFQLSEVYNKISQNYIIFTVVHCNVKYFNVMYQKFSNISFI